MLCETHLVRVTIFTRGDCSNFLAVSIEGGYNAAKSRFYKNFGYSRERHGWKTSGEFSDHPRWTSVGYSVTVKDKGRVQLAIPLRTVEKKEG